MVVSFKLEIIKTEKNWVNHMILIIDLNVINNFINNKFLKINK